MTASLLTVQELARKAQAVAVLDPRINDWLRGAARRGGVEANDVVLNLATGNVATVEVAGASSLMLVGTDSARYSISPESVTKINPQVSPGDAIASLLNLDSMHDLADVKVRVVEANRCLYNYTRKSGQRSPYGDARVWVAVGNEPKVEDSAVEESEGVVRLSKVVYQELVAMSRLAEEGGETVTISRVMHQNLIEQAEKTEKAEKALADLWEALAIEAENRDWCEEYDQFAEENGGPARERDFNIGVRMTSYLSASNLDDAIAGLLNFEGRDVDVREGVDVEHDTDIDMTLSATVDQIEDGDFNDKISQHLRDQGWQFEDITVIRAARA